MFINALKIILCIVFFQNLLPIHSHSFFLESEVKEKKTRYLISIELHRLFQLQALPESEYKITQLIIGNALKDSYLNDTYKELNLHLAFADLSYAQNEFDNALKHYQIFLEKEDKNYNVHYQVALIYGSLAESNKDNVAYQKALDHMNLSLFFLKKEKNSFFKRWLSFYYNAKMAIILNSLAEIYAKNESWQDAFDIQLKAINYTYDLNLKEAYADRASAYLEFLNKKTHEN